MCNLIVHYNNYNYKVLSTLRSIQFSSNLQLIFMISFYFLIWKSCDCVTPEMNNSNSHVVMATLFDSLLKIFSCICKLGCF